MVRIRSVKGYARFNVGRWLNDERLGFDSAGSGGEPPDGGAMVPLTSKMAMWLRRRFSQRGRLLHGWHGAGNAPEQSSGDDGHRKPAHDGGVAALARFKGWNEWGPLKWVWRGILKPDMGSFWSGTPSSSGAAIRTHCRMKFEDLRPLFIGLFGQGSQARAGLYL
jgi:hypothetical protein